jgi:hypothetical protein
VDNDPTGVDQFKAAAIMFGNPMDAVTGDARFIADNGPPLSGYAIEEGGLSYVGPPHDDHCGSGVRHALS